MRLIRDRGENWKKSNHLVSFWQFPAGTYPPHVLRSRFVLPLKRKGCSKNKNIEVNISQEVFWCPVNWHGNRTWSNWRYISQCTKQTGMLDKVRINSTVYFIHWYKSSRWGRKKCCMTHFLTSDPITSWHSGTSRQNRVAMKIIRKRSVPKYSPNDDLLVIHPMVKRIKITKKNISTLPPKTTGLQGMDSRTLAAGWAVQIRW